jgi:hypothetical protein
MMIAICSGDSRFSQFNDSGPCHSGDSRSQELQQEGQEVRRNEIDLAGWNNVAVVRVGKQPIVVAAGNPPLVVAAGSLDSAGAKK